jgi:hypothetical protein
MTKIISGTTGIQIQRNSDGSGEGIPAGIIQQVNELFTISKTISAQVCTVGHEPRYAASVNSINWRGLEWLYALDHGQGLQGSEIFSLDNPIGLNRCLIPTEQGSQQNGSSLVVCDSVSIFRGVSAAADRAYTITDAAEWFDPARVTAPLPYNTRKTSGFFRTRDITFGDGSDVNIIKVSQTLVVPTRDDVQIQRFESISPASIYSPSSTFTRLFTVAMTTGTTTTEITPLVDGDFQPTTRTTPYIMVSTDGTTSAIGVYAPTSQLRELGYYQARYLGSSGFMYLYYYDMHDTVTGMSAGNRVNDSYVILGTLAEVAQTFRNLYLKYG